MGGANYDRCRVFEYIRVYLDVFLVPLSLSEICRNNNLKMGVDGYETEIDRYFAAAVK